MKNTNHTFLVVEDNELDVEKIMRSFKRLKLSNPIVHAMNGYEALEILRGENSEKSISVPYIILLDLNMPMMNGLEFLDELRRDKAISPAPVFVLTTSDRKEDVAAAYKYNVCGYIVKPVGMEQMLEALGTLNKYWGLSQFPIVELSH